ncbi:lymphatic vessel endothelial hyaluronic acid receptor 1a [Aulostomus maculatus]
MHRIWLCIASLLSAAPLISSQNVDTSQLTVIPKWNHSIVGVFQVSALNSFNQPHYAFNVSEARQLCSSLGVRIASLQEIEEALRSGFETCRYGWVDEQLGVIPRIKAVTVCGKNQTGLVPWRAAVTHKFDVFCFNESDKTAQLEDAKHQLTSKSPLTSFSTSSLSLLENTDSWTAQAHSVATAQAFAGGKAALIACSCALLLLAAAITAYIKQKRKSESSDLKRQKEYMKTEEPKSVTMVKEPEKVALEDERIKEPENTDLEDERIKLDDTAS